ncbi:MAG: ribonuclease R, partial [Xanthobacteraceae bacterium]
MSKTRDSQFPDRDALIAFIRVAKGEVGTREIARAFGLKNADRVELKRLLRELTDEGVIARRGRTLHEAASLPPTVLADVTARDRDGELLARPAEWDEETQGAAPKIRIHLPRHPK